MPEAKSRNFSCEQAALPAHLLYWCPRDRLLQDFDDLLKLNAGSFSCPAPLILSILDNPVFGGQVTMSAR